MLIQCILSEREQVTRGHNIVADGWAGASTPQPTSNTQTYTKSIENAPFQLDHHDGPTDRRTDGPTDKASYRVARPQLKIPMLDFAL